MKFKMNTIDDMVTGIRKDIENKKSKLIAETSFYCDSCNKQLSGFLIYSKEIQKAYCNSPSACASEAAFEAYKYKKNDESIILNRIPLAKLRKLWEKGDLKQDDKFLHETRKYKELEIMNFYISEIYTRLKKIQTGIMPTRNIRTKRGIDFSLSRKSLNPDGSKRIMIPMKARSFASLSYINLNVFSKIITSDISEIYHICHQLD